MSSDIHEVQNTDLNLSALHSSGSSAPTDLPDRESTEAAARILFQHSDSMRVPISKDTISEGVTKTQHSDLKSNGDTHLKAQKDDVQKRSSSKRIEKGFPMFNTYYLNLGLCSQIYTLQQDVVGLLRWQDRSSMTIREMKEEARTQESKNPRQGP